jgi:hypothetical protein
MTLDDFNQLCHDQWVRPDRGDVAKLWLTDESATELTNSILSDGDSSAWISMHIAKAELPAIKAGASVGRIVNPVTRSDVMVTPGNPADTAVINFGYKPAELVEL